MDAFTAGPEQGVRYYSVSVINIIYTGGHQLSIDTWFEAILTIHIEIKRKLISNLIHLKWNKWGQMRMALT